MERGLKGISFIIFQGLNVEFVCSQFAHLAFYKAAESFVVVLHGIYLICDAGKGNTINKRLTVL